MHERKINELVEILHQATEGRCAIALAGAHAKGTADEHSDIDFFIYADAAKPYNKRLELIVADEGTLLWVDQTFDPTPWGGSMDLCYQRTPV